MKVILAGATGFIGGETLRQCIAHDSVTSILVLTRRELPKELSTSSKVTTIIQDDFMTYSDTVLTQLAGAESCIWVYFCPVTEHQAPQRAQVSFCVLQWRDGGT